MTGQRGVGVFRLFGRHAGWLWTLALLIPVLAVLGYGLVVSDPAHNPAPVAYREAACATHERLGEAMGALAEAVALARADGASAARDEASAAQTAAVDAIGPIVAAPDWTPGEGLTAMLRAVFNSVDYGAVTLITGEPPAGLALPLRDFVARSGDPIGTAQAALEVAQEQHAAARETFAEERYGFDCPSV